MWQTQRNPISRTSCEKAESVLLCLHHAHPTGEADQDRARFRQSRQRAIPSEKEPESPTLADISRLVSPNREDCGPIRHGSRTTAEVVSRTYRIWATRRTNSHRHESLEKGGFQFQQGTKAGPFCNSEFSQGGLRDSLAFRPQARREENLRLHCGLHLECQELKARKIPSQKKI